ncbi:MAG: NAD(P)H-dependent oxidoreductase [Myxococcales bacterium]|nr:NAD(P)H-dependent oxidoreductase [Myxococcales bacterium]
MKIIGVAGSLRSASYNRALLESCRPLLPGNVELETRDLHGIPLYDGDLEAEHGIPAPVQSLKEAFATSDAILIATPEYNSGMPGVMKNAIDWCSRPNSDLHRVFGDKPLAIMGATPGPWGTRLAQASYLPVFRSLGVTPWTQGQMYVARANEVFRDGQIVDEATAKKLENFLTGFLRFARAVMRPSE